MSKKVVVMVSSIVAAIIVTLMALASHIYVETIYPFQNNKYIYATCGNLYQTNLQDVYFAKKYGVVNVSFGEPEFWRE